MKLSLNCRFLTVSIPISVGTFIKHSSFPTIPAFKCVHIPAGKTTTTRTTSASATLHNPHFQTLTSHQRHQIGLYMDSLLQWNQKMNLTAVKDENEVMERHVEDSLAIVKPICSSYVTHCGGSFQTLSVVDVGSGAGLPGIILAIACPSWQVTLVESMNKRCVFLEHVVGSIGLPNVQVIRERAENLGQNPDFREGFDVAVARAVAEMRVLAEYCLPLVRVGGLFLAAKGHDPQEEVTSAKRAIHLMGASLLQICFVESHSKYGQRTVIICRKNGSTPKKYPRVPGRYAQLYKDRV